MAFEEIRSEDLRMVMSHLAQTAYGTRLIDAKFTTGGMSFCPKVPTMGEVVPRRIGGGPRPFSGQAEWNVGDMERYIAYDSSLALSFDYNSWLAGWFAAFFLGSVVAAQEGATTHYTHTAHATDPMLAAGIREALVTSIYLDSGGPDATRFRHVISDLAISDATISGGPTPGLVQFAVNLIGSGMAEVAPTITNPALATTYDFPNGGVKIEYGVRGAGLTDISDRIGAWSLRFNQNLDAENGYYAGTGLYRGRIKFIRRTFSIELAIKSDRANLDLRTDMLAQTRKELKFTFDSGVVAGTSALLTHHMQTVRYPNVRIADSPLTFEGSDGVWGVRVAEDQVYKENAAATEEPITIVTDNIVPFFIVAP